MKLSDWKKESLKAYDYKCVITGQTTNLEVHHLYSLNLIIDEVIKELNLTMRPKISGYSKDELSKIEYLFIKKHKQNPFRIPIMESLHKKFHTIYGDNATIEDFKDYLQENNNKKLKVSYTSFLKKERYFPYKKNRSSKYQYVTYVKSDNKWQVTIPYGKKMKFKNIGRFNGEYEAAEACNKKLIELYGEDSTINKLDENDKPLNYGEKKKFHDKKTNNSSIYYGVNKESNSSRWLARILYGNERIRIGTFENEWLAADAYNQKAVELFGDDALLNKLSEEHQKEKLSYVPKKKITSSKYTGVSFNKRDNKWCASVHWDGKRKHIGYYINEIDAAKAYNKFINENGISKPLNEGLI